MSEVTFSLFNVIVWFVFSEFVLGLRNRSQLCVWFIFFSICNSLGLRVEKMTCLFFKILVFWNWRELCFVSRTLSDADELWTLRMINALHPAYNRNFTHFFNTSVDDSLKGKIKRKKESMEDAEKREWSVTQHILMHVFCFFLNFFLLKFNCSDFGLSIIRETKIFHWISFGMLWF